MSLASRGAKRTTLAAIQYARIKGCYSRGSSGNKGAHRPPRLWPAAFQKKQQALLPWLRPMRHRKTERLSNFGPSLLNFSSWLKWNSFNHAPIILMWSLKEPPWHLPWSQERPFHLFFNLVTHKAKTITTKLEKKGFAQRLRSRMI